jgi:hypothetical protein
MKSYPWENQSTRTRLVGFNERIAVGESDEVVLAVGEWMDFDKRLAMRGGTETTVLSAIWGMRALGPAAWQGDRSANASIASVGAHESQC